MIKDWIVVKIVFEKVNTLKKTVVQVSLTNRGCSRMRK